MSPTSGTVGRMIISGTHTGVWIDLGRDQPGMLLQRHKPGDRWRDYLKDSKVVQSPVDIAQLPLGKYWWENVETYCLPHLHFFLRKKSINL
ncbi:MAG: hypothetical protein GXP11_03545 [Gammaproteobacteria bacterium]|nr:hypothetical protein [Gammaproteobacteria bacterium]